MFKIFILFDLVSKLKVLIGHLNLDPHLVSKADSDPQL